MGSSAPHVEPLIDRSKGDTIIDYRGGSEAVVVALKKAVGDTKILHALDAVSAYNSKQTYVPVLQRGATISLSKPSATYEDIPEGINKIKVSVMRAHGDCKDFAFVFFRYLSRGLREGWLKPQPQELVPGGLGGIQGALQNLIEGKAHGVKYVFSIADTPGAGNSL